MENELHIAMELAETDLFKILMGTPSRSQTSDTNHGLTEQEISIVMRKILEALVHCHDKQIIHRDLKVRQALTAGG